MYPGTLWSHRFHLTLFAELLLFPLASFFTWAYKAKAKSLSRVQLFATPWTVVHQAPLSMVFFMQEYWDGLPFPSPGDLPDPGMKPGSPALQADALPSEPPWKLHVPINNFQILELPSRQHLYWLFTSFACRCFSHDQFSNLRRSPTCHPCPTHNGETHLFH